MKNILIVDDERDIVNALKIYLSDPDYKLYEAFNGKQALDIVEKEDIHLILMDIMMPVMDGITALNKIREKSFVPIILLTAKSEDADKVLGLTVGADDYITKPFNPLEVTARVKSQLRRYLRYGSGNEDVEKITIGGIELDDSTKQVLVDGNEITLTPKEFEILKLLMSNPGKVYSPKEIYSSIWQEKPYGAENTVAVHIRHIREKIEINQLNQDISRLSLDRDIKLKRGYRNEEVF